VPARRLGLAALLVAVTAVGGCGSGGADSDEATGAELSVYSSLPLQGPTAAISEQIVGGEKLALAQAGGRAGRFHIGYVSLDDANPASGSWSPGVTASNAKTAAQDTSTIAYLGDYNSPATAVSLPLMNAAGIPQISPGSPYVGLTSSLDAGQDEPERFYPSGRRTFIRLPPGNPVEAAAQVRLMSSLKVHKLYLLDDQDPFALPLAEIVAGDAGLAHISVLGHDSIPVLGSSVFTGEVEKIVASRAQAVFFSGEGSEAAAILWQELHTADPKLLLLGSSSTAQESFASQIGPAAAHAYIGTPILPTSLYPPAAEQVLGAYRRAFGGEATAYALYGYEAMRLVLQAIRGAGANGNNRQIVTQRLFAGRHPYSVLGPFSIEPDGETTLMRYGVDRVSDGRLVFYRAFSTR